MGPFREAPKEQTGLRPIGFHLDSRFRPGPSFHRLDLKLEEDQNFDLLTNDRVILPLNERHPIDRYLSLKEITAIKKALTMALQVSYLVLQKGAREAKIIERLGCNPLSNKQLAFIMRLEDGQAFRQRPVHHLLLSLDHWMIEEGFKPIHPQLMSPLLAKETGLTYEIELARRNLFHQAKLDEDLQEGFVFCLIS